MNLNYKYVSTGSHRHAVNYYIANLLYEMISDVDSDFVDLALGATDWSWDYWSYIPGSILDKLEEAELEKIRAEVAQGLSSIVHYYEELLMYLRELSQDRTTMDYIYFSPMPCGVMILYPHVVSE